MQNNENFAENANAPLIRVEQGNSEFSIIQSYVESGEEYPVPFEEFWTWVGYATKQKAENCLLKNFKPQIDFNFNQEVKVQMEGKRQVKRNINTYYLTLDCAKAFAMLAQTDRGQEIRGYFLDCEKKLKAIQKNLVTEDRLNRVLTIIEGNFTKVGEYMGELEERLEKRLDALEARYQQNTGKIDDTEKRVDKIEEHLDFKSIACVYVMFCPHRKLYKFGSSHDAKGRRKQFSVVYANLEIMYEIPTISRDEAYTLENALKKRFKTNHSEGEWYALDAHDLEYLYEQQQNNRRHLANMA